MTTSNEEQLSRESDGAIAKSIESLVKIGKLWAVHGLEVGRAALETSSKTLETTAELLGSISKSLEGADGEKKNDEPAGEA